METETAMDVDPSAAFLGGVVAAELRETGTGAYLLGEAARMGLQPEHLTSNLRGAYMALRQLLNDGKPLDPSSLSQVLRSLRPAGPAGVEEAKREPEVLRSLFAPYWNAESTLAHARTVYDQGLIRSLSSQLQLLAHRAQDWTDGGSAFHAEALRIVTNAEIGDKAHDHDMRQESKQASERLWEEYASRQELRGLCTGFPSLNRKSRGLQKGKLYVLSGPSGGGKTAMMGSIAINAARGPNVHTRSRGAFVRVYSLEMDFNELYERFWFGESGVNAGAFHERRLSEWDREQLHAASTALELPIVVNDDPHMTFDEMVLQCRFAKSRGELDLVVVDYAQILPPPVSAKRRQTNREEEVRMVAQGLKRDLARSLEVPVFALAQENKLGGLRESEALKHESDGWMSLDLITPEGELERAQVHEYDLHLRKMRGGKRGKIPMQFYPEQTRFEEVG